MKNMFRVHIVAPGSRTSFEENNPIRLSYGKAISMAMTPDEARRLAAELNAAASKVYLESEPKQQDATLPGELCEEYDAAAMWCARRGLKGEAGDALPANMDPNGALKYINADPEAFQERVRLSSYALAMSASASPV